MVRYLSFVLLYCSFLSIHGIRYRKKYELQSKLTEKSSLSDSVLFLNESLLYILGGEFFALCHYIFPILVESNELVNVICYHKSGYLLWPIAINLVNEIGFVIKKDVDNIFHNVKYLIYILLFLIIFAGIYIDISQYLLPKMIVTLFIMLFDIVIIKWLTNLIKL